MIVDQNDTNPAAVAAAGNPPVGSPTGVEQEILNTAPDEGLSAPFNSMLTFFGQFFDHGLDFVDKGNGTVFMALDPSDPLHSSNNPGASPFTDFVPMTRTVFDPVSGEPINKTTPFVDQNQTYGSHPAKNAFLRQYIAGTATPTGHMLEGAGGGMANWDELQAGSAANFGLILVDEDVHKVPLLVTDLYGNLMLGAGAEVMISTSGGNVTLSRAVPQTIAQIETATGFTVNFTKENFLADIANHAAPGGGVVADANTSVELADSPGVFESGFTKACGAEVYVPFPLANAPFGPCDGSVGFELQIQVYDDEMLGQHFIAGDGRVNENIALTSVHHVFHSEHNRLVEDIKLTLDGTNPDHLGQAPPLDVITFFEPIPGVYNGDRMFAAAKLVTEMQYQHLVFEEFGRTIVPNIDPFLTYDASINAAIQGEFAHTVYRFGHSMLSTDVARFTPDGVSDDLTLFDAFLNPPAWKAATPNSPARTAEEAAGAIFRGGTAQVGNEIDEFVIDALRNQLIGLPLDLPAINMARSRDAQIPRLNEARRQFYAQTNNEPALKPYDSWNEFGLNLKNSDSLVNFIAVYGDHASLNSIDWAGADPVGDRRAAATALLSDADFMFSAGVYAPVSGLPITGLENVDLWVGGLAEAKFAFGSFLGTTFEHVFEEQMENLQNGDRFYYLARLEGEDLLNALEGNSLSEIVSRNTDAERLPSNVFAVPTYTFDMNQQPLFADDPTCFANGVTNPVIFGNQCDIVDDPNTDGIDESALSDLERLPDGSVRYSGGEHVNFIGRDTFFVTTGLDDRLISGAGDDTVRGSAGDDRLEGGDGGDNIIGGLGNDILTDVNGDDDIKGGPGHDYINGGAGFDLLQGGDGDDVVSGGSDDTETLAGNGDDIVFAGNSMDVVLGGGGDDWIEGGPGGEEIFGDRGLVVIIDGQDPVNGGNDVIDGGQLGDAVLAEGGADIFKAGPGTDDHEGGAGFDWLTHYNDPLPADTDLSVGEFTPAPVDPFRDAFNLVEGLSGWIHDDILVGDGKGLDIGGNSLLPEHVAVFPGLEQLLDPNFVPDPLFDDPNAVHGGSDNIIIGGPGSDVIQGGTQDDILDGDAYLRVQLVDTVDGSLHNEFNEIQAEVADGTRNGSHYDIEREIVLGSGLPGSDVDRAVFQQPRADYDLSGDGGPLQAAASGSDIFRVNHARGQGLIAGGPDENSLNDGNNVLRNIEELQFLTFDPVIPGNILSDELVYLCDGKIATVFPTSPNAVGETLTGTSGDDVIVGTSGNDIINGNGGNDVICGRNGNDTINLIGTPLIGNTVFGGGGDDTVNGSEGNDTIYGEDGLDTLNGAGGNDFLDGGLGANIYDGGAGDDWLEGGAEGETMDGGAGNDTILGYGGADALVGGIDNDYLWGGDGLDTYSGGDGVDVLDGNDTDNLGETMNGGAGNDQILGYGGDDTMNGDGDSDFLWGGAGADTYNGGAGDDVLTADGQGADILNGDGGADFLSAATGTAQLNGGADAIDICVVNGTGAVTGAGCEAVLP